MISACRLPIECKGGGGGMTSNIILRYFGTHSKNSDDDITNPENLIKLNFIKVFYILVNPEKEIGAVGEKRDVILWGNFGDFVLFRDDSRDTFFAVPRWTFIFSVTQSVSQSGRSTLFINSHLG